MLQLSFLSSPLTCHRVQQNEHKKNLRCVTSLRSSRWSRTDTRFRHTLQRCSKSRQDGLRRRSRLSMRRCYPHLRTRRSLCEYTQWTARWYVTPRALGPFSHISPFVWQGQSCYERIPSGFLATLPLVNYPSYFPRARNSKGFFNSTFRDVPFLFFLFYPKVSRCQLPQACAARNAAALHHVVTLVVIMRQSLSEP